MDNSVIGGSEIIILAILFVFGLWWLLSFLPGKIAATASALLVSFSLTPQQPPIPIQEKVLERTESRFL
jgi:hypothetical protein